MTYTTNYNLHKPDVSDLFQLEDWNSNSDVIDTELKSNKDKVLYYGTCSTSRATNAKVVTCPNFVLEAGCKIVVKFTDTAGAAPTSGNITLNINSTGAKNVYNKNNTQMSYSYSGEFRANRYCEFTYDGTNFIWLNYDSNSTYSGMVDAVCSTDAATAAKAASGTNLSTVKAGALVLIYFSNANTAQSALTLNCGGSGAKPLYIDGLVSSASNYTVNKATYLAYYNGTNWYIRNDNKLPFTPESADKWTTARNISISDSDGTNTGAAVSVDGSAAKTLKLPSTIKANLTGRATSADSADNTVAVCSTSGSTAAKIANLKNFELSNGQNIILYLANSNTASGVTLNINSTGAKTVRVNGASVTSKNLQKGFYRAISSESYWDLYTMLSETSSIINQSTNYIKLSNGLMIQWGFTENLGNIGPGVTKTATINFTSVNGYSYNDGYYSVQVTLEGSTSGMEIAIVKNSDQKTGFQIIGYNRNSNSTINNVRYHWFTIGSFNS